MKPNRRDNRSWWRRAASSPVVLGINLVLLGFVGFSVAREAANRRAAGDSLAELKGQIADLEKKNGDYVSELSRLGSPSFVEQEARLKLGYQKPGEQVLIIRNANAPSDERPAETAPVDAAGLSNPQKWWLYFMGDR